MTETGQELSLVREPPSACQSRLLKGTRRPWSSPVLASAQFSRSVVPGSPRPCGPQPARPVCPSPMPVLAWRGRNSRPGCTPSTPAPAALTVEPASLREVGDGCSQPAAPPSCPALRRKGRERAAGAQGPCLNQPPT